MHDLIKPRIIPLINNDNDVIMARGLHEFIQSKENFTNWVKPYICDRSNFNVNSDFWRVSLTSKNNRGMEEYAFTVRMAKHICMMSKCEKGMEARDYFLDCERKVKGLAPKFKAPESLSEALLLAYNQAKLIEIQTEELEQAKPKVEFVEKYVESSGIFNLTQASKNLKFKRKDLIECLIRDGRIFRRGKKGKLEPYVTEVNRGMFEIKTGTGELNHAYSQMYITAKGMNWIAETYATELGE